MLCAQKTCYIDIDIVLWNKSDLRYMLSYTMEYNHHMGINTLIIVSMQQY